MTCVKFPPYSTNATAATRPASPALTPATRDAPFVGGPVGFGRPAKAVPEAVGARPLTAVPVPSMRVTAVPVEPIAAAPLGAAVPVPEVPVALQGQTLFRMLAGFDYRSNISMGRTIPFGADGLGGHMVRGDDGKGPGNGHSSGLQRPVSTKAVGIPATIPRTHSSDGNG